MKAERRKPSGEALSILKNRTARAVPLASKQQASKQYLVLEFAPPSVAFKRLALPNKLSGSTMS
ncbi:MAG: hypothetical protein U0892_22395 [Pirellulales bacterium]